ncbi:MAG: hypothetical protein KDD82_24505 [Planctomycetes bacterium]|nr:hypothetical protein [Planctomycetota bacterium]
MSRADKTLTKIVYRVTFDETRQRVTELQVTTLCAQKNGLQSVDPKVAFSSNEHIAFVATYRFSQEDAVEIFPVPAAAGKLLK